VHKSFNVGGGALVILSAGDSKICLWQLFAARSNVSRPNKASNCAKACASLLILAWPRGGPGKTGYRALNNDSKITPVLQMSMAGVCSKDMNKTSGARKPGVPALSALIFTVFFERPDEWWEG
jgi:hypothetical protein|tara:strand:+ start:436 stop:804 length:369 start_codon:yes stop_codon:yes gene_type:complete